MANALLIVNRQSNQGKEAYAELTECLESQGISFEPADCDDPSQLSDLLVSRGKDFKRVILGGGDGTLNAGIRGLKETGLPLGIIPLGTANDLARSLGLPDDISGACEVITAGHLRSVDVGQVNEVFYFNVANIGFGTEVSRRVTAEAKKRWGVFGYLQGFADALQDYEPFRATISCDGEAHEVESLQIGVGNGRFYGGGTVVDESAAIDDSRLDLYSIKPDDFMRLLAMAPAFRQGRHRYHEAVLALHGECIEIETDEPMDVNVDGEIMTETPAVFRVHPKAVKVYVPQDGDGQGLSQD